MSSAIERVRQLLIHLNKPAKLTIVLAGDLFIVPMALWLAFFLRLGTDHLINPIEYAWLFLAAIGTTIPVFAMSGLYTAVLRYMGRETIAKLFTAVTISALLLGLAIYWSRSELLIPRTLVINYWLILFSLIGAARFMARAFLLPGARNLPLRSLLIASSPNDARRRVAIYGAGNAGVQLYMSIQRDKGIWPVAFIDDDPNLQGRRIGGLRIYGREDIPHLIRKTGTREIFLAIPSLQAARRQQILEYLERHPVHVRTVPSIYELATGRKDVRELQEVRVEDILGREVVAPAPELLERCIRGKVVMVTGGGGSIGSELCRQIIELDPKALVIFEHSEFNLFSIEDELRSQLDRRVMNIELTGILGSVLDPEQLLATISSFGVETIYHSAAYKHVSIVEQNMAAGLRNNVFGTLNAAYAAIQGKVENFVLISSDKAVRPINIMGASKRLAELILQSLSAEDAPDFSPFGEITRKRLSERRITRFTIVRFGNVLGSSGSVIPKFRKQIQNGGPVSVTHPDVTRYFMTMDEAAQLVIQASSMGAGGDVFILDMGKPVKILDLAIKMIRLSGQSPRSPSNPTGDIEIVYTGLRPGEKLHEELYTGEEAFPTGHPKVFRAQEAFPSWSSLVETVLAIQTALEHNDLTLAKSLLNRCVGGDASDDESSLANPDTASPARKPNVVPLSPRVPS